MHTWVQAMLFGEGTVMTEQEQQPQRPTLSEALRTVISESEMDDVEIKRVEIDVTGGGAVIYRIYLGTEVSRNAVRSWVTRGRWRLACNSGTSNRA